MIAKFEKRISSDAGHTSFCKYKNLQNLIHWHIEHEIIFVSCGSIELNVNNKPHILSSGMCAFIQSGETHYIKGSADSVTHVIKTHSATLKAIIQNKILECPVLKNDYSVESAFSEVKKELKSNAEYKDIITDSIITRLVAEIFRNEVTFNKNTAISSNEQYNKLLKWITKNHTYICFEDAAKYMNFSKSYFSKYFKKLTGMKFTEYLNILKVSSAIEKINSGENNMTDISISCGFGTIRNFNRVFKSLTGYTPKQIPRDYVFLYTISDSENIGFDPTLNCSEIVE